MTEGASAAAYFSSAGLGDAGSPLGGLPDLVGALDGVAPGHLAVSGAGGQELKVSFLRFPGAGLVPGAVVPSALLSVPLAQGEGSTSFGQAPGSVRACAIGDGDFDGEDGAALAGAPQRQCDAFSATARSSADGTAYVFDVTGLVRTWTRAGGGLALTVGEEVDSALQVVFAPGEQARLTYDAAAPGQPGPTPSGGPAAGPAPTSSPGSGVGGPAEPDLGAGSDGGGPAVVGGLGPGGAPEPVVPEPAVPPELAGPPVVAPPLPAPAAEPVAVREPSAAPGAAFWAGVAALALVLLLVSLVLGDARVAQATRPPSRLSRALASRGQARPG